MWLLHEDMALLVYIRKNITPELKVSELEWSQVQKANAQKSTGSAEL